MFFKNLIVFFRLLWRKTKNKKEIRLRWKLEQIAKRKKEQEEDEIVKNLLQSIARLVERRHQKKERDLRRAIERRAKSIKKIRRRKSKDEGLGSP